ncbi:MAG: hypothetical protein QNJ46_26165 [Leptolyngbyaceae cyanobacterium MO_188.B28]|nr:hypothetical protein [Leptolyngbyaceae cyanobacterium MO_188.B28]
MKPPKPTPQLIRILGLGWLAYLLVGLGLSLGGRVAKIQVVIDRGYCSPTDWGQVANDYAQLYQQHRRNKIVIESVTLVNNLGEEVLSPPPTAAEIAALKTFGLSGRDRIDDILQLNPEAKVFGCGF